MPGGRPKGKTQADKVKSITKVLDILEHLGSSKNAVSVSDLARETKINVSTAYRLMQTLTTRGYVVQEQTNRGYTIGPRFFQLGSAYLEGNDLASIARPYLDALRDAVQETAYLAIYNNGEVVQLCKSDGVQAVSASVRSLVRDPAYCTANGRVLLSGLPPKELKAFLEQTTIRAHTPQTLTNKTQLLREIKKIGEAGFAIDIEEFVPNLCCISVPVRNGETGATVAAICIAMPKMRFKKAQVPQWCALLRQNAQLISQKLGLMDNW